MTSISIAAKASRDIKSHVATLETDHGPAGAHAACALVKLAYAGPHHRAKIDGGAFPSATRGRYRGRPPRLGATPR